MKHRRKAFIIETLSLSMVLAFCIVTISCSQQPEDDVKRVNLPRHSVHTDHSGLFYEPFADGPSVTRACLKCHQDSAREVMQTAHWNWQGEPVKLPGQETPIRIGKRNVINNFCIGVQSNWPACTQCHIGYGWEDEKFDFTDEARVDCLVCHDNSGTYIKKTRGAGYPDESVDLLEAARSVGLPKRKNCGSCHFQGGGGDAIKHGDMDDTLLFPSARIDLHMGKYDMQCIDCHKAEKHLIRGRSMAVSVDSKNFLECTDCHNPKPHADVRLNAHTDRLSCQACHVPHMGADTGTKLTWDWSEAGQDLDITNEHLYLKIKGRFTWSKKHLPEYYWYNKTSTRYIVGDHIDPSKPTSISRPNGDRNDPEATIWPFKVHRGKQPYDLKNQYFLVPNVHGDSGFWTAFDWPRALEVGSRVTGLPYSGEYDFAPTEMFFPLSHMVASLDQTLNCRDCHGEKSRLDWAALGYPGDPLMHQAAEHDPIYLMDANGEPVSQSGEPLSIAETCGMCHELEDEGFIDAHGYHTGILDETLEPERLLLMQDGPRIPVEEDEQMNCFLCHLSQPDHASRLEALLNGPPEWSVSASLISTGVVSRTDDGYAWNTDQVGEDGEAMMQLRPVSESNCGSCHGMVHDGSDPLIVPLGEGIEWTTEKTGQVFSPQQVRLSALNLSDKDGLDIPWDVHAERLVSCGDCHYSRKRPARLAGEVSPADSASSDGNRRRCQSCHSLTDTHRWLPEQEKHFNAVTCESCHVPRLEMAAQKAIDATVMRLGGTPQISYRGIDGELQHMSRTFIRGYQPLLNIGTGAQGERKVLPYNLVTSWFWVDKDTGENVQDDVLVKAWLGDNSYDRQIMQMFDTDGDGTLANDELRLDGQEKVSLIQQRLRENGVSDPVIKGEIRAYHIHHNVRHGDHVNRDCTRCHDEEHKKPGIFILSPYQPGNVMPSFVTGPTDIELNGDLVVTNDGILQYVPNHDVSQSYKNKKLTKEEQK